LETARSRVKRSRSRVSVVGLTPFRTTWCAPGLHARAPGVLDCHYSIHEHAVGHADRLVAGPERGGRRVDPDDLSAQVADADRLPDVEVRARVAAARERARDLAR